MKQKSKISKLRLGFVATALASGIALTSVAALQATSAVASPYHQDVLPNGVVTGPIAPDANGG
jgi:hypothetical protein